MIVRGSVESKCKGKARARASVMVMWLRESRMGRIAICGALPHLMPIRRRATPVVCGCSKRVFRDGGAPLKQVVLFYLWAAVNEARQVIHISSILPMRLSTSHRNCLDLSQLRGSTEVNNPIGIAACRPPRRNTWQFPGHGQCAPAAVLPFHEGEARSALLTEGATRAPIIERAFKERFLCTHR